LRALETQVKRVVGRDLLVESELGVFAGKYLGTEAQLGVFGNIGVGYVVQRVYFQPRDKGVDDFVVEFFCC
jgi:hypothetical protein